MRLTVKKIRTTTAAVLLLFLSSIFYINFMTVYNVKNACVDKYLTVLDSVAEQVDAYFKGIQDSLLASTNPVDPLKVNGELVARMQRLIIDHPEIIVVSLTDKEGKVAYSTYVPQIGIPLLSLDYKRIVAERRAGVLSGYNALGRRMIMVYAPLYKNGDVVGVIHAGIGPQQLNEMFLRFSASRPQVFFGIVDSTGVITAFSDLRHIGKDVSHLEPVQRALSGERGWFEGKGQLLGDDRLFVYRLLGSQEGALILSQRQEYVYQPVFDLLKYQGPVFLLWTVLFLFVFYQKWRSDHTRRYELLEMQAEKANAVAEIAASVAHEVRNPLTGVRGFMQLLASRTSDPKAQEYSRLIVEEVDRVEAIIGEFLSLAKPHSMERQKCSLTGILRSVYLLAQGRGIFNGVEVIFNEAESIEIYGDGAQLKQAFLNLCNNAIQAMPKGGKLMIAVKSDGSDAVVTIQDTGDGIAPENLERLGERFFTTKDGGSGLGLSIVYRVIEENHRGRIFVDSKVGGGTTFRIFLPLQE